MKNDDDMLYWFRDFMVIVFLGIIVWLPSGCTSPRKLAERSVRDSIVYTYKTLYRDSLRVKDSTIIVYSYVQRDSVVLKVDKNTGKVISTDTWHWRDVSKDRDRVANVRSITNKEDSTSSRIEKNDKQIFSSKKSAVAKDIKKTHYWKTFWIGLLSGIFLSFMWRYRKRMIGLLKKFP